MKIPYRLSTLPLCFLLNFPLFAREMRSHQAPDGAPITTQRSQPEYLPSAFAENFDAASFGKYLAKISVDNPAAMESFIAKMLSTDTPWVCGADYLPRNLHNEVAQIIAKLTPQGRAVYENIFGASAAGERKRLQAKGPLSPESLSSLAYRFRGTKVGRESLQSLIRYFIDSGDWELAWLYSKILLTDWPVDRVESGVLLRIERVLRWAEKFEGSSGLAMKVSNSLRGESRSDLDFVRKTLSDNAPNHSLSRGIRRRLVSSSEDQKTLRDALRFGVLANPWKALQSDTAPWFSLSQLAPRPDMDTSRFGEWLRSSLACRAADLMGAPSFATKIPVHRQKIVSSLVRLAFADPETSVKDWEQIAHLAMPASAQEPLTLEVLTEIEYALKLAGATSLQSLRDAFASSDAVSSLFLADTLSHFVLLKPEEQAKLLKDTRQGLQTDHPLAAKWAGRYFVGKRAGAKSLETDVVHFLASKTPLPTEVLQLTQGIPAQPLTDLLKMGKISPRDIDWWNRPDLLSVKSPVFVELQNRIQSDKEEQRTDSATALGHFPEKEAREVLYQAIELESHPAARRAMIAALVRHPTPEVELKIKKLMDKKTSSEELLPILHFFETVSKTRAFSLSSSQLEFLMQHYPSLSNTQKSRLLRIWIAGGGKSNKETFPVLAHALSSGILLDFSLLRRTNILTPDNFQALEIQAASRSLLWRALDRLSVHSPRREMQRNLLIQTAPLLQAANRVEVMEREDIRTGGVALSDALAARVRAETFHWKKWSTREKEAYETLAQKLGFAHPNKAHLAWLEKLITSPDLSLTPGGGHRPEELAFATLERWSEDSPEALGVLLKGLNHPNEEVRIHSVRALGRQASEYYTNYPRKVPDYARSVVDPLLQALKKESSDAVKSQILSKLSDFPGFRSKIYSTASELAKGPASPATLNAGIVAMNMSPDEKTGQEWITQFQKTVPNNEKSIHTLAEAGKKFHAAHLLEPLLEKSLEGNFEERRAALRAFSQTQLPATQKLGEKLLQIHAREEQTLLGFDATLALAQVPPSLKQAAIDTLLRSPERDEAFWTAFCSLSTVDQAAMGALVISLIGKESLSMEVRHCLIDFYRREPRKMQEYLIALSPETRGELKTVLAGNIQLLRTLASEAEQTDAVWAAELQTIAKEFEKLLLVF